MAASVYPPALPGPTLSAVKLAERRFLSDVSGGPEQARSVQRDYLGSQTAEWFLGADQAQVFSAWWSLSLVEGGAWFASTWPAPQGWLALVRRFSGSPPKWSHVAGGFWRVSATLQVRGRGLLPTDCVHEFFTAGLGPYTTVSGDRSLFSVAANVLHIAAQNANVKACIQRSFTARSVSSLSAKFTLGNLNADDAAVIGVHSAGVLSILEFNPRREARVDSLQRPQVYAGGTSAYLADGPLIAGDTYRLDLTSSADSTLASLFHLPDGVLVKSVTLAAPYLALADSLQFIVDQDGLTTPVSYSEIHIC